MKYRNEIFLLHICIVEDLQVTARSIELKFSLLTFFYKRKKVRDHGGEGTPGPIPNTVVKLARGDNTWLVTAREDNSMPTQITKAGNIRYRLLLCLSHASEKYVMP